MNPKERNTDNSELNCKLSGSEQDTNERPDFVRASSLFDPAYGELISWDWGQMKPNGGDK